MACYGTVLGYNFERAALATPSMSVMCVCTHTHAHVCNWVRSEGYAGALQVRCCCFYDAYRDYSRRHRVLRQLRRRDCNPRLFGECLCP